MHQIHSLIADDVLALVAEELLQPVSFWGVFPLIDPNMEERQAAFDAGLACRKWANIILPLVRQQRAAQLSLLAPDRAITTQHELSPNLTALGVDLDSRTDPALVCAMLKPLLKLRFLQITLQPALGQTSADSSPALQTLVGALEKVLTELPTLKHISITTLRVLRLSLETLLPPRFDGHLYLSTGVPFTIPARACGFTAQLMPHVNLSEILRAGPILDGLTRLCFEGGFNGPQSLLTVLPERAPNLHEIWINQVLVPSAQSHDELRALFAIPTLRKFGGTIARVPVRGQKLQLGPSLRHLHVLRGDETTVQWLAKLGKGIGHLHTLVFYETEQYRWYPRLSKDERKKLRTEYAKVEEAGREARVKLWKGPIAGDRQSRIDRWHKPDRFLSREMLDEAYSVFRAECTPAEHADKSGEVNA